MNINEDKYQLLLCIAGELAKGSYVLRLNEQVVDDAKMSDKEEGNYDLCITSARICSQIKDVLLLRRNDLVKQINQLLQSIEGCSLELLIDEDEPWRLWLCGDEERPEFTIDFVSYKFIAEYANTDAEHPMLFFPEIDFGDIPTMDINAIRGEFWNINGNTVLGRALWPFRIDLDGNCMSLEQIGNVTVCDCTEK